MRIIGNIDHPNFKITVFKMDNRLSVKLESGLQEQTYKFRMTNDLQNFEDVQRLIDEPFLQEVQAVFSLMDKSKNELMHRFYPTLKEEFEEII